MGNLQVLVVTMNQGDFSLAERMNLRCDAVIANQADREEIMSRKTDHGALKMITTKTKGVGLNRNIALLASDAEFVLFADDDVVYNDDMPDAVVNAFRDNPRADVLIFGVDITHGGKVTEQRHLKKKRLHIWNALRYGTYRIAIRRAAVLKNNLSFHQCFGGGCMYSSGEDSLFIKSCFDCGLRVYTHDYVLGTCAKDTSTWFVGFNEKYFYDKGALVRCLFPCIPYLMAPYFAIRFKRETNISVFKRLKLVFMGVRGGKTLCPYRENS